MFGMSLFMFLHYKFLKIFEYCTSKSYRISISGKKERNIWSIPGPLNLPLVGTKWIFFWQYSISQIHDVYASKLSRKTVSLKISQIRDFFFFRIPSAVWSYCAWSYHKRFPNCSSVRSQGYRKGSTLSKQISVPTSYRDRVHVPHEPTRSICQRRNHKRASTFIVVILRNLVAFFFRKSLYNPLLRPANIRL